MHLQESGGDKLEDLDGELRDEIYVRAAMWRVRE
jgi:hypothetical protein